MRQQCEYNFIQIPVVAEQKAGTASVPPFEACKQAVHAQVANGRQLGQSPKPQMMVYGGNCYQLIFEREVE